MRIVGVDPAENLAVEANKAGIPTVCAYWSVEAAEAVVCRFGQPRIVTATNVLAHADDVHGFVGSVVRCLAPRGIFVVECPYIVDFIEKNEFDTVYHEHLSYFGIHPLRVLMNRHRLSIFNVQYFEDIHGGTIRVFVARDGDYPLDPSVAIYLKNEEAFGIKDPNRYEAFGRRVLINRHNLLDLVGRLHGERKVVWAYGASAKGNTLMNYFGISKDLVPVAVDDNPKKRGFYTPGSHMRITGIDELARSRVDYLLLLAWNFEAEIIRRCRAVGYAGGFIRPVPEAGFVDGGGDS
jgi:SAM-dependent methyltransferase